MNNELVTNKSEMVSPLPEYVDNLLYELRAWLIDEECEGGREMFHKVCDLESYLKSTSDKALNTLA